MKLSTIEVESNLQLCESGTLCSIDFFHDALSLTVVSANYDPTTIWLNIRMDNHFSLDVIFSGNSIQKNGIGFETHHQLDFHLQQMTSEKGMTYFLDLLSSIF